MNSDFMMFSDENKEELARKLQDLLSNSFNRNGGIR